MQERLAGICRPLLRGFTVKGKKKCEVVAGGGNGRCFPMRLIEKAILIVMGRPSRKQEPLGTARPLRSRVWSPPNEGTGDRNSESQKVMQTRMTKSETEDRRILKELRVGPDLDS